MQRKKLSNGIKVILEKRKSESIVMAIQVNTGANNEYDSNRGISHFTEHMLFEGTKKRTAYDISSSIEKVGGEINAFTSHDRTVYYSVIPKKHFCIALSILSDIIQNPKFDVKAIEKERKVIIDEVNLTLDDQKFYQFIFFLSHLYKKHPIRHPLYGYKETINSITKEDILDYYNKHYTANNIIIAIIGNIKDETKKINAAFSKLKAKKSERALFHDEPQTKQQETFTEKKDILHSYIGFGYKTPNRKHKDSYAIDIIQTILAKGQSSRLFNEIRTKRGLCYAVGSAMEAGLDYGYLMIYAGTDKKNIDMVVDIIKKEVKSLQNISNKEINEAKTLIEGSFIIENEDPKKLADTLIFWNSIDERFETKDYINKIKKVSRQDIIKAARKHLNENYLLTILSQK